MKTSLQRAESQREQLSTDLQTAETLNTKLQEDLERCQKTTLDLQDDKQQSDQKIIEQQVFRLSIKSFINVCFNYDSLVQCRLGARIVSNLEVCMRI